MDKRYKAEDLRKVAKSFLSSEVNLDFTKRDIAKMLLQYADELVREKKYEYVVEFRYCGKWKVYKDGLTLADARKFASEPWCSPHRIVKREVGEWEVVSWG